MKEISSQDVTAEDVGSVNEGEAGERQRVETVFCAEVSGQSHLSENNAPSSFSFRPAKGSVTISVFMISPTVRASKLDSNLFSDARTRQIEGMILLVQRGVAVEAYRLICDAALTSSEEIADRFGDHDDDLSVP